MKPWLSKSVSASLKPGSSTSKQRARVVGDARLETVCIGVGAESIDAQPANTRRDARTHLLAYSGGRTPDAANSLGRRTFFRLLRTSSDAIRPTRRRAPRRTRPRSVSPVHEIRRPKRSDGR